MKDYFFEPEFLAKWKGDISEKHNSTAALARQHQDKNAPPQKFKIVGEKHMSKIWRFSIALMV